jgi:hypothetical protein
MSRFLKNVILVAVVNLIAYAVGGGDAGVMLSAYLTVASH